MARDQRAERQAEIRRRLIETAKKGGLTTYGQLHDQNARAAGGYLFRIADEELAATRPPLTAVVVRKGREGRPGKGFETVAKKAGYERQPGETDEQVWRRALADVYAYWRGRRPTSG